MTKLITEWIKICQSGNTVDGRKISPKWLTDIAESYDKTVYIASININHDQVSGNFGHVESVKAEKTQDDQIALYAQLTPNRKFLAENTIYQDNLRTSIEIKTNFAKTGKAYLTGLALTDNPASLGTDMIKFTSQAQGEHYEGTDIEPEAIFLTQENATDSTTNPQQEENMKKEQFETLQKNIQLLTEKAESQEKALQVLTQKAESQEKALQSLTEAKAPAEIALTAESQAKMQTIETQLTQAIELLSVTDEQPRTKATGNDDQNPDHII